MKRRLLINRLGRKFISDKTSSIGVHINWNTYNKLIAISRENHKTLNSLVSEAVENFLDVITEDDIETCLYNYQLKLVSSKITQENAKKLMELIEDNSELSQTHIIKEAIRRYLIKHEMNNEEENIK